MTRYNAVGTPEKAQISNEQIDDNFASAENTDSAESKKTDILDSPFRQLRSGKIISINVHSLPKLCETDFAYAKFSQQIKCQKPNSNQISILSSKIRPAPTPYASFDQNWNGECWIFSSTLLNTTVKETAPNYKTRYRSKFQSPIPGTLHIDLDYEPNHRKIKFTKIEVHFY